MYIHSVLMANGEKHYVSGSIYKLEADGYKSSGTSQAMRRDELYDPANGFVFNDSLTIHCEVNIIMGNVKPDLCELQAKYSQPEMVTKSMGNLLDSGIYADVTLVLVDDGGQELRAHKAILVTRSRVFADMFESKMAESETNRVEIVDTRAEVFKQALHFIYTGKVASLDDIAKDLLICADKYQLDPLKSICDEFLSSSCICHNNGSALFDLLQLANLHDAPKLKAKVVKLLHIYFESMLEMPDMVVQMKHFVSSLPTDQED